MGRGDGLYRKSLWVFHMNTGGCNGCDIEVINVLTPWQDVERFGIKLVGSPRHADAILFTGPVTNEVLPRAVRAFMAVPEPKVVVAIGSCACGGGIWHDSYSVLGGIDRFYDYLRKRYGIEPPPTVYVPGCPPRPEAIIYGICLLRGLVKGKQRREVYVEGEVDLSSLKDLLPPDWVVRTDLMRRWVRWFT